MYNRYNSYGEVYAEFLYRMASARRARRKQSRQEYPNDDYNPFQKEPVVIYKPIYKHPEPIRTKIRRFELPKIEVYLRTNTWKVATNQKDTVIYRIAVEGEGSGEIPKVIADKIREGSLYIEEYSKYKHSAYIKARRYGYIKTEAWSLRRLLWECLKESQYVEFEEIKADSL